MDQVECHSQPLKRSSSLQIRSIRRSAADSTRCLHLVFNKPSPARPVSPGAWTIFGSTKRGSGKEVVKFLRSWRIFVGPFLQMVEQRDSQGLAEHRRFRPTAPAASPSSTRSEKTTPRLYAKDLTCRVSTFGFLLGMFLSLEPLCNQLRAQMWLEDGPIFDGIPKRISGSWTSKQLVSSSRFINSDQQRNYQSCIFTCFHKSQVLLFCTLK